MCVQRLRESFRARDQTHDATPLTRVAALRRVQNMLRHEVNKLQAENTKLHVSIDELETQVNEYVLLRRLMNQTVT